MKALVVVESRGKINKIQKILGSNYIVMASDGHILDLPVKTMSIDIKNNFKPNYKPTSRSKKTIIALKDAYKKCDELIIAADRDREGEMIAWSIADVLKIKNPKRIVFASITKEAILDAIKKPGKIDQDMVDAAKARRILDRIVGYELSPILWKNVKPKLSAGRVQSVIVRLIVDREIEIEEFIKNFENSNNSFFRIKGLFDDNLETALYEKNKIVKFGNKKKTLKFIEDSKKSKYKVMSVVTKPSLRNPSTPFTTSTLQQEASRKIGLSVVGTMRSAQILYEAGLITYMRTDSVNLSKEALNNIGEYVKTKFGCKYYNKKIYKTKGNAQEAHEAVRPTDVFKETTTTTKNAKLGNTEERLYKLIWKRTVASQMTSAKFDVTTVKIGIDNLKDYNYRSVYKKLIFDGFLKVYNLQNLEENEGDEDDEFGSKINLKVGDKCVIRRILATQDFNKPIGRYNEASLINKIDNLEIGRPATQANIITRIQDKRYVEKKDSNGLKINGVELIWTSQNDKIKEKMRDVIIGGDTNKFAPTNLGRLVNEFLVKKFKNVMDYKFTSDMEKELDNIAGGKKKWIKVLDKFYKSFHSEIEKLQNSSFIKDEHTHVLGKDDATGYEIISTHGIHGPMVKLCGPTKSTSNYAPVKKPLTIETITLKQAKKLLEYPKDIGKYNRKIIKLQTGAGGLYLKYNGNKYNIGETKESEVTVEKAIEIIEDKNEKSKGLGQFESDLKIYTIYEKFSKCILVKDKKKKGKNKFVKLPDDTELDKLTLADIEKIVEEDAKKPRYTKKYKKKYKKK
jgi:DNA topoisomerase-1